VLDRDRESTTIHDLLRHTFVVHCAQVGVPLPRIQKLLRYMQQAPEAYFVGDAVRIAGSIQERSGPGVEQEARAENARASIRLV
jgi:hypothetical protein